MIDLKNSVAELGIILSDDQVDKFNKYYELLIEWNNKFNLTSITDYDEVVIKHFVDSLSLVKAVNVDSSFELIDVGTGAGFPGIPIAIVFTNARVTLLDSLNKRVTFLNEVIEVLGLNNVVAFHGRAEDFARGDNRERFDYCVSRAVANLSTLTELCSPFVKVGGSFISYKSEKADEELSNAKNAIFLLGCGDVEKINFTLPETDYERNLLIIHKKSKCSGKYPRKAGLPGKQPL